MSWTKKILEKVPTTVKEFFSQISPRGVLEPKWEDVVEQVNIENEGKDLARDSALGKFFIFIKRWEYFTAQKPLKSHSADAGLKEEAIAFIERIRNHVDAKNAELSEKLSEFANLILSICLGKDLDTSRRIVVGLILIGNQIMEQNPIGNQIMEQKVETLCDFASQHLTRNLPESNTVWCGTQDDNKFICPATAMLQHLKHSLDFVSPLPENTRLSKAIRDWCQNPVTLLFEEELWSSYNLSLLKAILQLSCDKVENTNGLLKLLPSTVHPIPGDTNQIRESINIHDALSKEAEVR